MIMQSGAFQALLSLLIISRGAHAAVPVTLHRAGTHGFGSSQLDGLPATVLSATAIGVGSDGGTTYAQVVVNSGMVTRSLITGSGTPVLTSFVEVQTLTNTFVEQASWVYQSTPSFGKFNEFEQNCTFADASKDKAECVEVYRVVVEVINGVSGPGTVTTTQAHTQTLAEPVKPWFTSAASRCVSSSWLSVFGIALAVVYF